MRFNEEEFPLVARQSTQEQEDGAEGGSHSGPSDGKGRAGASYEKRFAEVGLTSATGGGLFYFQGTVQLCYAEALPSPCFHLLVTFCGDCLWLQEERRLAYVALSRPKATLLVSYVLQDQQSGGGNAPPVSRFLKVVGCLRVFFL